MDNMEKEARRRKIAGLFSSKGTSGGFILLSILGILVGLYMLSQGVGGKGLSSGITIVIGLFVTIKEILDIFH